MPRQATSADRTTGTRPDRTRKAKRRATPATVILLVRHGTTTTTGRELPGRAPGLHLAESGVRQAEEVAARIARLTAPQAPPTTPAPSEPSDGAPSPGDGAAPATDAAASGPPPSERPNGSGAAAGDGSAPGPAPGIAAVYASPLERTRETAEPIARAVGRTVEIDEGLVELDVGDWTGMALKDAAKRPEWTTIQRYPSGFTFPGGESFLTMQARIVSTLDRLRARHPGQQIVAVSHADPIRAAVAHAMGTHLDLFQRVVVSPCSVTAIALGDDGPLVLTVNATGDSTATAPS